MFIGRWKNIGRGNKTGKKMRKQRRTMKMKNLNISEPYQSFDYDEPSPHGHSGKCPHAQTPC
jgi:hypothetical protein